MNIQMAGIRNVEDALMCVECGVNIIGLLVGQMHTSDDFITKEKAKEIKHALPKKIKTTLITHLESSDEIVESASFVGVDGCRSLAGRKRNGGARRKTAEAPFHFTYARIGVDFEYLRSAVYVAGIKDSVGRHPARSHAGSAVAGDLTDVAAVGVADAKLLGTALFVDERDRSGREALFAGINLAHLIGHETREHSGRLIVTHVGRKRNALAAAFGLYRPAGRTGNENGAVFGDKTEVSGQNKISLKRTLERGRAGNIDGDENFLGSRSFNVDNRLRYGK